MIHLSSIGINIRFLESGPVKPWMGAVFRGAFGAVLRELSCRVGGEQCVSCPLVRTCAYGYVFETPVPPGLSAGNPQTHAPHPFAFKPPLVEYVKTNDELEVNLALIGKGTEYLPYFLIAVKEVGRRGIGANRSRFRVISSRCLHTGRVVSGQSCVGSELAVVLDPTDAASPEPGSEDGVGVELITPLRIKAWGKPLSSFAFLPFAAALARKTVDLAWWHCGVDARGAFDKALDAARSVQVTEDDTRYVTLWRKSFRQGREIPIGGLLGRVVLAGDLKPFRGLFRLAEYVGTGAKTSFGLGQVAFEPAA